MFYTDKKSVILQTLPLSQNAWLTCKQSLERKKSGSHAANGTIFRFRSADRLRNLKTPPLTACE
jgi:hypothetical protein